MTEMPLSVGTRAAPPAPLSTHRHLSLSTLAGLLVAMRLNANAGSTAARGVEAP